MAILCHIFCLEFYFLVQQSNSWEKLKNKSIIWKLQNETSIPQLIVGSINVKHKH